MALRLGLHRMSSRADGLFRDYVERVRPNVVKFLDPGAGDEALAAWCRSLGTEVIGRVYFDPQELGAGGGRQIARVLEAARACPSIRYWELHNEAWQADEQLSRYAELSIDFMRQIDALGGGRHAVIGCFSVGMPDIKEEDPGIQWHRFVPALRYAAEHGHVLGLHQYGGGSQALRFAPLWYALRHRQVIAWAKSVGLPMPRVLITESGVDNLEEADRESRGWKTLGNTYDYPADLAWLCRELSADPLVLGIVDFGWATQDRQWGDFDLSDRPDVLERLITQMRALQAPTPPAPKPPKEVPVADLHQMLLAEFGPSLYQDLRAQMADRPGFNTRPLSGVDAIAIHHTAGAKDGSWLGVRNGHWARGFSGIGYHLGIRQGVLYYLGDVSLARACVAQTNHKLICLVFAGDYTKDQPDPADLAIARRAIRVLDALLGRRVAIRGHRDYMATECPGPNLYARLADLRGGAAAPAPAPPPAEPVFHWDKVVYWLEEADRRLQAEGCKKEAAYVATNYTAKAIAKRDGR